MKATKSKPDCCRPPYLSAALALAVALTAPYGSAAEESTDDAIELSPFEVTSDDASGYQAANTLAGTRLRSSLEDVASPISVFTTELLEDVAASNMQEAMLYSVNVENENEYAPDDGEGESISSTTQNRVRGLTSSTQTRGFFKTNFRADTYNIERLTVASGPNSILFGIGSPAGVIDATPATAQVNRNSGLVSFRVDSNDSMRVNGDYNLAVVKDVFAVRVAGLAQKLKTFRTPEFDDERRQYVAMTYKPFRTTTIRADYEHMTNTRVRARDTTMEDNVSDWIAAGKPLYDHTTGQWTTDNGQTWEDRPDLANWINDTGIGWSNRVFMGEGTLGGSETQGLLWGNMGLSYDPDKYPPDVVSDDRIFSSKTNYYGTGDQTRLRGNRRSVVVEQKFTDNLYAEVGYSRENNSRRQDDPLRLGLSTIQADANYYLPYPQGTDNGTPLVNPNAGRYFIESEYLGWTQDLDLETRRAMVSYNIDFAKYDKGWLGKYNFGLLWQKDRTDEFRSKNRLVSQGSYWIGNPGDVGQNNIRSRYYLDIPGLGGDSNGVEYPGSFDLPAWPTIVGSVQEGPTKTRTDVTGKLFVVQGSLLQDKLILTYGYRHDKQEAFNSSFGARDPETNLFITDGVDLNPTPTVQSGITRTYNAVYHTPLKWLSVLYSRSNAFNPQGNLRDWFNNPLPPGTGEGEDYGVNLKFLDGKLQARITRFTNTSKDNVELDWYYESPKWGIVGNLDADWGNIAGYARRLGTEEDIKLVDAYPGFSFDNVRATRDFSAEGYEAELFYTPTKQLDLRFTLSKTEATNQRVVPHIQAYIDSRIDVWEKYWGYPAWGFGAEELPAWVDDWNTTPGTLGYNFLTFDYPRILEFQAAEGSSTARGRKWRANLVANYRFEGKLKGVSLGGAGRWRSSDTIGYYGKANELLPEGRLVPDVTRPISGDDILLFDGWIEYGRVLNVGNTKLDWSIQLNIRNLLDDDKFVALSADVDGTPTSYSRNEPRTFILTNTFRF